MIGEFYSNALFYKLFCLVMTIESVRFFERGENENREKNKMKLSHVWIRMCVVARKERIPGNLRKMSNAMSFPRAKSLATQRIANISYLIANSQSSI